MRKKDLMALPCVAPEWMLKKVKQKKEGTMMLRRKFGSIWTYEFYSRKQLRNRVNKPMFIIFREGNKWLNYEPQGQKWTTGMLENVRLFCEYENEVRSWSAWSYLDQYKILGNLKRWQRAIVHRRQNRKKAMIAARTKRDMAAVPELPLDFERVVENDLMGDAGFLVYDRRKNFVYCTQCREEYRLDECEIQNSMKMVHMQKEEMRCIKCGMWMQQVSIGHSRRKKTFKRGIDIVQNFEKGVVIREFIAYRFFEENKKEELGMKTEIVEIRRRIYKRFEKRVYEVSGNDWEDMTGKNLQVYRDNVGMYYKDNLQSVLKRSEMTRSVVTLVMSAIKKNQYNSGIDHIFANLVERPCIEQIKKAGLNEIAKEMIEKSYLGYNVNEMETTPAKALGITKNEFRYIRAAKGQEQVEALEALQYLKKYGVTVGADFEELRNFYKKEKVSRRYCLTIILDEGINPIKLCRYVTKQGIRTADYRDHLEIMKRLNIRKNKKTLWPGNFRAEHQREIEEDEMNKMTVSDKIEKQMKERYERWKKLAKDILMTDGEYKIMFPPSGKDIKTEGRVLHHCVGTYVDRVAAGETMIFYVRKVDEPDTRLYTAEYLQGRLQQIRASCNGVAADRAKKLAKEFARQLHEAEVKEGKNARTRRATS